VLKREDLLEEFMGRVYDRLNYGPGSSLYLKNKWMFGDVYYDTTTLDILEDMNITPKDLSHYVKDKGDTLTADELGRVHLYRKGKIIKTYEDLEQVLWDVHFSAG